MVTGHEGISASCRAETATHSEDDEEFKGEIAMSEASNDCSLRRALPERRDEEGVEELEVGKTFDSSNVQQFTSQSNEVFSLHLNMDFDLLILPQQRW